jgi:alpha-L-rhamnosidase
MTGDKSTAWTRREIIQGMGVTAAELAVAQALLPMTKAGGLYPQAHARVPAPAAPSSGTSLPRSPEPEFASAQPVWPKGLEREKNLFVGFRASCEISGQHPVLLRVTGSTIYRIFVNGAFRGYGPARGPHEYYRVDEWDLTPALHAGQNWVALEVAGYNVNSYYLLDQPSFLQAEVVAGENVLASTAGRGHHFEAGILRERLQKVQRYSFQRPFSEVYRLQPRYDRWRSEPSSTFQPIECSVSPRKQLLPRRVPYPEFALRRPVRHVSRVKVRTGVMVEHLWKDRFLTQIGPKLGGFLESELEVIPSIELQHVAAESPEILDRPCAAGERIGVGSHSQHIVDFGADLSGFIGVKVTCPKPARLFLVFDEILSDGDVDFKRLSCVNIVSYELAAGSFALEAFEPYTLRYLKLLVLEGECEFNDIYVREYANPDVRQAHFLASDERLHTLFAAGRETYRQNSVDVFTDCPSRERAGWLCDSFFTSRVALDLSGSTTLEKNFFENFQLPRRFAFIPEGMLPMCYPADHNDGNFVPNWALWFILQLEEYLARSGDHHTIESLRPKIERLFAYFKGFENEDGLLEKLQGWVFVEWSKANDYVQDVSYPSNMLYAAALDSAARMYSSPGWAAKAARVRETIRRQSFDGHFFVDNALRQNGRLEVTRNCSEVCQYFAFFTGTASPETHPELWRILKEQFGPRRQETKAFSEVVPANAFVGNVLRLELLSQQGLSRQILDESVSYYLYMAERTGTLWELISPTASCNHGFASHVVHMLYRNVLGLWTVDPINKRVHVRLAEVPLSSCAGGIPTTHGMVELSWKTKGDTISYQIVTPEGYKVQVENLTAKKLTLAGG